MNEKELDYDAWESIKRKGKKIKYEKKWTFGSRSSLLCPYRVIVSYFSLMVIKGTLCFIKPPYIGIFKEI